VGTHAESVSAALCYRPLSLVTPLYIGHPPNAVDIAFTSPKHYGFSLTLLKRNTIYWCPLLKLRADQQHKRYEWLMFMVDSIFLYSAEDFINIWWLVFGALSSIQRKTCETVTGKLLIWKFF